MWLHLYPEKHCATFTALLLWWGKVLPNKGHKSAKRAVDELCGEVIDYRANFELLQFQFDRHIMRTLLGSMKDQEGGYGALQLNEHRHWTPAYRKRHHRYVTDLVAQRGPPQVFLTIAAFEFHFAWPYWLEQLHKRSGPTQLAGPEALAVAHAIHQFCSGYVVGFGPDYCSRQLYTIVYVCMHQYTVELRSKAHRNGPCLSGL